MESQTLTMGGSSPPMVNNELRPQSHFAFRKITSGLLNSARPCGLAM
jgi:hypothetical protein